MIFYMESMESAVFKPSASTVELKRVPMMDVHRLAAPKSVNEFNSVWYSPTVSQGITGACWCFSATSFLESEIYRKTERKVKLSEMYAVYYEYLEKAERFLDTRGESYFGRGSEPDAALMIWKKYGVVPESAYPGNPGNTSFYNHSRLFPELRACLENMKKNQDWDKEKAMKQVKAILDKYMGAPPRFMQINGSLMSPQVYMTRHLKINPDDYLSVLSLNDQPFYEYVSYRVSDNWRHSKDYYNLPVKDFMTLIDTALKNHSSVCIVGDISEPGYSIQQGIAVVADFDIPASGINDTSRRWRFATDQTTDEHAIHLVGTVQTKGKTWYLIKDSGSSSRNNQAHPGYFFYRRDYVQLKMMNLLVARDIVGQVLSDRKY